MKMENNMEYGDAFSKKINNNKKRLRQILRWPTYKIMASAECQTRQSWGLEGVATPRFWAGRSGGEVAGGLQEGR